MTIHREDILWVAIRIIGLYFLVRALLLIPDIYGAISFLYSLGKDVENIGQGIELSIKTNQALLLNSFLTFVFFMVIAIYLLRGGQLVFNLIKLPGNHSGSNK